MEAKDYYRNYQADNKLDDLDYKLIDELLKYKPSSAFEFGCGSGKNLKLLKEYSTEDIIPNDIETCGLDISIVNVMQSHLNGVDSVIRGDERHFPLRKFDVTFTCSVLDHIKDIDNIIGALQVMTNKAIIIAETNIRDEKNYYYKHNYESFGFVKIDYSFVSVDDACLYEIWIYEMPEFTESQKPVSCVE